MKTKKYGVLVHGAGWVSTQHIAAFQKNPATRVVAISSRRIESVRRRAYESGLEHAGLYDDFEQALEHPGVDIVSICTPQHIHCANVLAAAGAGKHLVIEKPVANSVLELRAMQKAVAIAGVKSVVSFVLGWNPLFHMVKTLMADGALGRPYYVEVDYLSQVGSWWSGWRDTHSLKTGVSAMLVGGCHAVDALRWFASAGESAAADPVEVYAISGGHRKGKNEEFNPVANQWVQHAPAMEYDGLEVALVKFSNGVLGKVSTNFDCVMPYRFPVRIFGDRGSLLDNRLWSHKFPGQRDWVELPALCPDSSDVTHHPFQAQMDHLVECVEQNRESHCNLEDAIKTHEVVFGAQECYRTGRPVRLPLVNSTDENPA
jgi:predicted dehydrogenase